MASVDAFDLSRTELIVDTSMANPGFPTRRWDGGGGGANPSVWGKNWR